MGHNNGMVQLFQLPSVQLIGAQKAGTSSIAKWLFEGGFRRPRVFDGEPWYYRKETHFFDIDWNFNRGIDFYARRFRVDETAADGSANAGDDAPILDATPDTLAFAQRVYEVYQSVGRAATVKIIVILRDPIPRELSLYNHLAHNCQCLDSSQLSSWDKQVMKPDGSTVMSFDEFVRDVTLPALATDELEDGGLGRSSRYGLYASHLQRWFELFERSQILVLSYFELCENPEKLQERIQNFLGRKIPGNLRRENGNDYPQKVLVPSREARQSLESFMKPHNERLYQLLEARSGPPMEQTPFPRFRY